MLINSIDIQGGSTVQLVQGARKELDAGDPRPLLERFATIGELALIDLDAAMGKGSNAELIGELLRLAPAGRVRVGGGIRSVESARAWLDAGAGQVIVGTAANRDLLGLLPRERTVAALDARDGEIVTHGWTRGTGALVADRMRELAGVCGGFLVTFVEVEGTLQGLPMARALELGALAKELGCDLTVAGGVNAVEQIAELDRAGIDAQVGMAVYKGLINPADALWACCVSDRPDGLVPTVVCDERGGALGLAYSSRESVRAAYQERRGVYQSRKRGLWRKGESSGAVQELVRIDRDCDSDCLRFVVRQVGAFCHTGTATCFGQERGLSGLAARVRAIAASGGGDGSYTARLLRDPKLLAKKLIEEGGELGREAGGQRVVEEAADLLYFLMVKLQASGVGLAEVEAELDRRALKLARRGGDAKPAFEPGDKLNTGGGT